MVGPGRRGNETRVYLEWEKWSRQFVRLEIALHLPRGCSGVSYVAGLRQLSL